MPLDRENNEKKIQEKETFVIVDKVWLILQSGI